MLIIGITGGSGCGKSTVVKEIIKNLPPDSVSIIPQDSYYWDNKNLSAEDKLKINFDHPNSIEWNLLIKHLDELKQGKCIQMPTYSYVACARLPETIEIKPHKIIIVEGILIFTEPELRKRLDIKIFVDAEADDRLTRIIQRDTIERGRSYDQVLTHYHKWVKPMHQQFIEPTKRYADVIVPEGGENLVAIDMLASMIQLKMNA